ncbi:MAG: hypothetical protein ACLGHA_03735 [Gammaproteobacteria bacterium]
MWFAFGLVSLTAFVAFHLYRTLHWSWGWKNDPGYLKVDGKPYKLDHIQPRRGKTHVLRFGVMCPQAFHFRIKRETDWDRAAKAIGLSVEQSFNDPRFDETFYVVSDHPALAKTLAGVPRFRDVIKTLFRDTHLRKLTCQGQHLVAHYHVKSDDPLPAQYRDGPSVKLIVRALHEITDTLTDLSDASLARDPQVWKAAFLAAVASGVLFLGILEIFRFLQFDRHDPLLDSWTLIRDSAVVSFILLVVWLALTARWLRGSSYAHIVMGEVLISGGLGLLLCSYWLARDLNCEWDHAPARVFPVEVLARHHHVHRKSPDTYSLSIRSSVGSALPDSIDVSHRDYVNAREQTSIELHVKPGLLGYPWVERIVAPRQW